MKVYSQKLSAVNKRRRIASLTPEQRTLHLAKARAERARYLADPEKRALANERAKARYHAEKQDPVRAARRREDSRRRYWKNQRWRIVQEARLRAEKRDLAFNLTREWVESSWTGRCAITGKKFTVGGKRGVFSVSLDRKDNARGYTQDNCRWVLWAVNLLKHTGTDAEMFEIAKLIARSAP